MNPKSYSRSKQPNIHLWLGKAIYEYAAINMTRTNKEGGEEEEHLLEERP